MSALNTLASTKLATVTGIDAKTVATTELYVVPNGKTMVVLGVVVRVTSFTAGSKSVQAVASFGGNSATYDDYLNTVTYTVDAIDEAIIDTVRDVQVPVYQSSDSFRVSIETASDATAEEWAVDLFGYLL